MKKPFLNIWWAKLTHNGWAKLICLIIAIIIWFRLKELTQPGFIDQILTGTLTSQ